MGAEAEVRAQKTAGVRVVTKMLLPLVGALLASLSLTASKKLQ